MERSIRFALTAAVFVVLAGACACARAPEETGAVAEESAATALNAAEKAAARAGGERAAPAPDKAKAAPPAAKVDGEAREEGCDCAHKAEPEPEERVDLDVGAAPVRGPADAPVTIVIFSDFECPFCARVEATLRTLDEEHRGKLRFAFKNYPLPFHEHARLAAKAALAAGEQGRFWEYHDALFARQSALDPASLERVASELRLDVARFRAALASDRIESAVASDAAEATKLGVQGTPTFFVNGKRLVGARSIEDFRAAVDEALKGERR